MTSLPFTERAFRLFHGGVQSMPDSFYGQWRLRSGVVTQLRDDHDSPPESLLQSVWQHQRLVRTRLKTLDGRMVRVLHPGFQSREGGPDFRNAVVQFGSEPPMTGDIEVDLRSSGWKAHRHDRNPAFGKVILHVVWESEREAPGTPATLPISSALDASLGELSVWLASDSADGLPEHFRGKCREPLRTLEPAQLQELLCQAAGVRLRAKGGHLQARARQVGWEQALWEGLFRALGYKHNVWPMQCLGELRPRWAMGAQSALTLQARLFGIGGLLPAELSRSEAGSDRYLRRVWDIWWREQDAFADCVLPKEMWRFHGLRPANHPQRRLALASRWYAQGGLTQAVEEWCAAEIADGELALSLMETMRVEPDAFWNWHWTFRSRRLGKEQPLLGKTRVTDLAMNVVLPWLWIRAAEGGHESMVKRIERRFYCWPSAEDNSVLRLARERLLGEANTRLFRTAAAQQGLMQVVRDFCDSTTATCDGCKLPELLRDLSCGTSIILQLNKF